jgi:hypothetical protein
MSLGEGVLAVVITVVLATAVLRVGAPRTRLSTASFLLAGVVALPFSFLIAGGISTPTEDRQEEGFLAPVVAPATRCVVTGLHVVSPAACRTPFGVRASPRLTPLGVITGRRRFQLVSHGFAGYIDAAENAGAGANITGWVADLGHHRPADAIVLFGEGRFQGAVRPTVQRPDVAQLYGAFGLNSGFDVTLPDSGPWERSLQVIAVQGRAAYRLRPDCAHKHYDVGC